MKEELTGQLCQTGREWGPEYNDDVNGGPGVKARCMSITHLFNPLYLGRPTKDVQGRVIKGPCEGVDDSPAVGDVEGSGIETLLQRLKISWLVNAFVQDHDVPARRLGASSAMNFE